ncbi:hypothetical protein GCM10008957_50750 [Deinococcus ruber]|uniref:Uncharacterized protein n=1 Tax=Deinococcus ruber TaxID=1848197 RepID=A0A918FF98_9DEIO|nr:hypothetical protein GCM10008957_50750 [Deinococcus ruber]
MTNDITQVILSALSDIRLDSIHLKMFTDLFTPRHEWKSDSEDENSWVVFYNSSSRFAMHHRTLPLCICDINCNSLIIYAQENKINLVFVNSFNSFELSLIDQASVLRRIGWKVTAGGFDMLRLSASNILFATN